MIPVELKDEPEYFQEQIGIRGSEAIAAGTDPLPAYWRSCLRDLWEAYGRVCSYCCMYIPPVVGWRTVDHFVPKSAELADDDLGNEDDGQVDICVRRSRGRSVAYTWSNYRLACGRMNALKRDFEDVLDPFDVEAGWFEVEFTFFQVCPGQNVDDSTRALVKATIERLRLNDDECCGARKEWFDRYSCHSCNCALLTEMSPLVAREAERRGKRWEGDQ